MYHYHIIYKSEIQEMIDSLGKDFLNAKEALTEIENNPLQKISKCLQAFTKAQADLENINQYTINFFRTCKSSETADWSQVRKCFGMCKPLVSKRVLVSLEQSAMEMIATVFHESFHASDFESNKDSYYEDREDEAEEYAASMCKKHFDFEYIPQQSGLRTKRYCRYLDGSGNYRIGNHDEIRNSKFTVLETWAVVE